jgi:TIR domain-containing protein
MSSIFISHATEDKEAVARPIAQALTKLGYSVWYDEYSLKLGDSLRRGLEKGLRDCTFGIVVLSKSFFAKEWPQKELDALTTREAAEGGKIILPVWHDISAKEIAKFAPMLADKIGASTQGGIPNVINAICIVVGTPDNPSISKDKSQPLIYNFVDQTVIDWRNAIEKIFPDSRPKSTSWTDPTDIIRVLSHVARLNLNHCFFPSGGGMDLEGVRASSEENCIELVWDLKSIAVIRPKVLQFENFPGYPSLSYFRIEAAPLLPIVREEGNEPTRMYEELAEIFPGDYRERWVLDAGYYDHDESGNEIPLPKKTRHVQRFFRGSFVVFAKGSAYNLLEGEHDAYNAQHEKMDAKKFRHFISKIIQEAASKDVELEPDRRVPAGKSTKDRSHR